MNDIKIELCRKMIYSYHYRTKGKRKEELRNKIYLELQPFLMKWISAILSKRKIFIKEEEMLSKSWDCFEFCLKHYKHKNGKVKVPNHFYNYTNFYLKKNLFFPDIPNVDQEEDFELIKSHSEINLYDELDELKAFRNVLDAEYIRVFDDAVLSLCPRNNDRQFRRSGSSMSNERYQESKKIFKIVVDYLLRRGT